MIVLWVTLRNDEFGPSAPSDYQQGPLPMGTPRPQISMRPRPEVTEWLIGSRVRSRILTGTEIGYCRGGGRMISLRPVRRGRSPASSWARCGLTGRPHAAGISAMWHDGDLYFTSRPGTRKAQNLASNPAFTSSVKLPEIDLT